MPGLLLPGLALAQAAPPATAVVELREIDLTYPAEAVVEAVRQATLAAQVPGRVVEVRADAGDA
ncbi:MAG: efflux RND transporter periplasmic adaptor subunit, partial [Rhodocyclaceae bacterium]|nr:efflux RND transporter periplasmic adaptor subunit [Rhodocyclaceae bacterium]